MKEELQRVLWPKGHRPDIWAIVDAAQDQQVYWTLTNSFLPHSCLFAGALPEALEMAAPYLVQLDPEDKFTTYLAKNLGRNLGIFLQCDTSLQELRRHLRTFLTVKDTSGRRMLFRYYDPRVLRVYLPTCSTTELQTVFGPVKSFWTVSDESRTLTQFEFRGKDLRVTPQALGTAPDAGEELAPVIVPAQRVLAVAKGMAARQRVPVLLQGAGQGGTLRRSSAAVRFFRTVTAAEELPFLGGSYSIPPAHLEPDITIYAEAATAGEVTLTLEPLRGGKTETTMLAVELTLDGGPGEICVGLAGTRRRIAVRPVEPSSFSGRLTIRSTPGGPSLKLFATETSTDGHALSEGFSFDAPGEAVNFWLEGAAPSKAPGDAGVQLSVENSNAAGDGVAATVVSITPIAAEIAGTPSKTKRLPETAGVTTTSANPLVLLAGAADADGAVRLRAEVAPKGVGLRWTVSRNADDAGAVRKLSANPLPALKETAEGATMLTDAAGTFHLRATAGDAEGWGGPSVELEITLVHAAMTENTSAFNGRFCACARVPGTDQFRLHSGKDAAINLQAAVTLTGGGPDGRRGVEAIHGGWINNIVSDNSGARYKGGKALRAGYRYDADGTEKTVDFDEGPLLDAPSGGRCLPGSAPEGPLASSAGEPIIVRARIAPTSSWKVQDGGAIEQIWRYLECRSYLALWSAHAPGQLGILLQTGWSFTGDYACNATKTTRTIVPARLASTGTAAFPALIPAARTDIEAHPPASGDRGTA
ncbi:MAG: DUF4123 domain-containing protein [Bryobacteraceae bacterium]